MLSLVNRNGGPSSTGNGGGIYNGASVNAKDTIIAANTADVGPDGKIVTLDDPYGRDSQLIASLDATPALALNDQAKTRRS